MRTILMTIEMVAKAGAVLFTAAAVLVGSSQILANCDNQENPCRSQPKHNCGGAECEEGWVNVCVCRRHVGDGQHCECMQEPSSGP